MKLNPPIARKLMLLRDLDDKIDFARSRVQLQIILAFMIENKAYTPSQLVEMLGERRKAIIDALRKMESKGIIERDKTSYAYRLTQKGADYSKKLMDVLGINRNQVTSRFQEGIDPIDGRGPLSKDINELTYIKKAVIALANTKEGMLSLRDLAIIMGLSKDRAKSYLDLYSRPPRRFFRRITHPTKGTYYKLDKRGYTIYYKTNEYHKAKKSKLFKLRVRLQSIPLMIIMKEKWLLPTLIAGSSPIFLHLAIKGSAYIPLISLPFMFLLFILALVP